VTIFQVGIINICFLDILKTVKIQKLENIINRVHWGGVPVIQCHHFFFCVCVFEFFCTIHHPIMTILISINLSCKDEKKMSVGCIVEILCRFKVFIFHSKR